jgi:hypothetical protein
MYLVKKKQEVCLSMHRAQIPSPFLTFNHLSPHLRLPSFPHLILKPILGKADLSCPSSLLATSSKLPFAKLTLSVIGILGNGQNDPGVVTEIIRLA